ncbi:MAG: hypothetical protein RL636_1800 [Verrucomicrobiota bacterium]|jgi:hypothetical protein
MKPQPEFVLGFVGHRQLPDEEGLRPAIRLCLERFMEDAARRGGRLNLYCSISYGADLLAIECAHELAVPVHLLLAKPLPSSLADVPTDGIAADFKGGPGQPDRLEDWRRARLAIQRAMDGVHGGSWRVVSQASGDPGCYYDAGVMLVDGSDALLAVWDGQPAKGIGGTGDSCDFARSTGKPVFVLVPEPTEALATARGLAPSFHSTHLASTITLLTRRKSLETSQELFTRLDDEAFSIGTAFRERLSRSTSFFYYATLLGAATSTIPWMLPLLVVIVVAKVGFTTAAWFIQRSNRRDQAQARWLELRFASEIARGLRAARDFTDPLHLPIGRHRPEWALFARTLALEIRREHPPRAWQVGRDEYVTEHLVSQAKYFKARQASATEECRKLRKLGSFAAQMSPCILVAVFLHMGVQRLPIGEWEFLRGNRALFNHILDFLSLSIPLTAGYLSSRRQGSSANRRSLHYGDLSERLSALALRIQMIRTEAYARQLIGEAEAVLTEEQLEWRLRESEGGA